MENIEQATYKIWVGNATPRT